MDKGVKCRDCGKVFVIAEKEQEWYNERNWELPKRCLRCRQKRKQKGGRV